MPKKILLVDDHQMIREALNQFLKCSKEYIISEEADNGKEAFELMKDKSFDLVITDIKMPVMNGIELMENIQLNFPKQPVLVISMKDDQTAVKKMVGLGAKGYILKNSTKTIFLNAIEAITNGSNYFDNKIKEQIKWIIEKQRRKNHESIDLTYFEKEVLKSLATLTHPKALAKQLNLTNELVEKILTNLYYKTECRSMPGLTVYAIENNIL